MKTKTKSKDKLKNKDKYNLSSLDIEYDQYDRSLEIFMNRIDDPDRSVDFKFESLSDFLFWLEHY
jgi:hypothetical protein